MALLRMTPDEARRHLVAHTGLDHPRFGAGAAGVRDVLHHLGCIQLDPLDRIGTNADLVALARVDGLGMGQVYDALLPGHAFEHFAKERCLLPVSAFAHYRDQAVATPWWRAGARRGRLGESLLDDVLAEVTERGPVAASDLADRGKVDPIDWSGWKGTSKATMMALEVLWRRCRVVVCGRTRTSKVYDIPERALPEAAATTPQVPFARWGLLQRVRSAGLLSRSGGPQWSMLYEVRTGPEPDAAVARGELVEVEIVGSRRRFLASADVEVPPDDATDDRMRILGPLDPILWDRKLVEQVFGFSYVWEVYKPAAARIWGWYVCPLLHRGRLVGRLEAHVQDGRVAVDRLWRESDDFDDAALEEAIARHDAALRLAV